MSNFADAMLNWFDQNARDLPWRIAGQAHPEPYHVWLSEIMLQQTTVVTVKPYFEKFIKLWPSVEAMAAAPLDDILTHWAGLGYYARARNLHKCAVEVCHKWGGKFPETEEELLSLPGVGPYTAAAIAAIAFEQPAVVVDGNIERIVSRVFRIEEQLPKARSEIRAFAETLTPNTRPGDYAQSLMDLGSGICKPKKPLCGECPVSSMCKAFEVGDMEAFPKKAPKKVKPTKYAPVLWIENNQGKVLIQKREEKGLLGGMMEFPSAEWREQSVTTDEMKTLGTRLIEELGLGRFKHQVAAHAPIKHTFTHFHLFLHPFQVTLIEDNSPRLNWGQWVDHRELDSYALPTLMTKVAGRVLEEQKSLSL
ncbi:A/G-specific adenine glycosylase [Sneathiella sp. P13V-1]|uniref:A/G-specific adenine glycosylase n=1 Tax=Sneathiella sp. P13V-1 TaxID=2697366 RepID=UPI00187B7FBA|nr:A/G-specific adenine glycosylase [Sneathiella sp. P13V-1]MBE7635567.1 A/G-specific adenine glycosylase [Sneathiella sp. P13V-1]